jgi:hypothetical protein
MHRDAIRAAELGQDRGPHWIRLIRQSRLSNGGDVVDVDVEPHGGRPRLNPLASRS